MFDALWSEIEDMPGEIFDIDYDEDVKDSLTETDIGDWDNVNIKYDT